MSKHSSFTRDCRIYFSSGVDFEVMLWRWLAVAKCQPGRPYFQQTSYSFQQLKGWDLPTFYISVKTSVATSFDAPLLELELDLANGLISKRERPLQSLPDRLHCQPLFIVAVEHADKLTDFLTVPQGVVNLWAGDTLSAGCGTMERTTGPKTIGARVSPTEYALVRRAAEAEGLTISRYLRRIALPVARVRVAQAEADSMELEAGHE